MNDPSLWSETAQTYGFLWWLRNEPTVFQSFKTWHSRQRLTSAPVLFLGLTRPSSLLWLSHVTNIWLRSCDSLLSWISTDAMTQDSLGSVWSDVVLSLILLANAFYRNGQSAGIGLQSQHFYNPSNIAASESQRAESSSGRGGEEVWQSYRGKKKRNEQ